MHIPATQAVYQPISAPVFTPAPAKRKPKVALALGGGGARGFAHVGVIRVLEEAGIPIDMIVGASVGSLVGAIYAANPDCLDLEDVTFRVQRDDIFDFSITSVITGKSLAEGKKLEEFVKDNIPVKRIEKLKIPCAVVATDINTGDIVVLEHGSIARAVRASCAHPIYFQPVSYNGRLLVDGGIAESVPVSTAHKLGADIVIAVDVGGTLDKNPEGLVEVLNQTKKILVNKTLKHTLKETDILVRPALGDMAFDDFSAEQKLKARRAGVEVTRKAIPEIRKKIKVWAESQRAAIPIAF
jgi:NTE family protein